MRLYTSGLGKTYAAPVLNDVSLAIPEGEIHGIVGENGAGKSTLLKILSGVTQADTGCMQINEHSYAPANSTAARRSGVGLCSQELSLIENLSVAENMFLADLPGTWRLDRNQLHDSAAQVLHTLDSSLMPQTRVRDLSLADQQWVEIARVFAQQPQLMLLDEPTSALTQPDADLLHKCLRDKARSGTSIVYVSHRLQDVLDLCDVVWVLRDGAVVHKDSADALTTQVLIEHMSGQTSILTASSHRSQSFGNVRLRVKNLTTTQLPHAVSFQAHAGEILGVAGLMGAGRSELLHALHGLTPKVGGSIEIQAQDTVHAIDSVSDAMTHGVGFVPENRASDGIFGGQSLTFNTTIANLESVSEFGILSARQELDTINHWVDQLKVKCEHPAQDITSLSGGNQQKLMLARWLQRHCVVLLLDEPTRGIDVGAKLAIHELLRQLRTQGVTMLVVSSELDELLALCDRIMVMSDRRVTTIQDTSHATEETFLQAAFVGHQKEVAS